MVDRLLICNPTRCAAVDKWMCGEPIWGILSSRFKYNSSYVILFNMYMYVCFLDADKINVLGRGAVRMSATWEWGVRWSSSAGVVDQGADGYRFDVDANDGMQCAEESALREIMNVT